MTSIINSEERNRLTGRSGVGSPILRVKDLNRMIDFYKGPLGLGARRIESDNRVELGFGTVSGMGRSSDPLLVLKDDPTAKAKQRNFAGLFHFAILVPDRKSLAQAYLGVKRNGVEFDGFGDHLVSESLYLHDPEGNGIEIYRDRPRAEWKHDNDGHVVMDTLPLDLEGILGELTREEAQRDSETFPKGASIGHMHLRVTNLERSARFYHEKLGFDISSDWSSMGAMFLSYGGYHHHIGLNTWHSLGGKRHEEGEAGLDSFDIQVPRDGQLFHEIESRLHDSGLSKLGESEMLVSDPDGIAVKIRSD